MCFFENFLNSFSSDIAIDFGTVNFRIHIKGDDKVIIDPSVIAINHANNKVIAIGKSAKKMIGRTPSSISVLHPLKNGAISDYEATEKFIKHFIGKARKGISPSRQIFSPRIVIAVPSIITEVEINAVIDSAKNAGARKVFIVKEPIMAALGEGINIDESSGKLIVDVGGGTTDIAVISMGDIVVDRSITIAGEEMDSYIVKYVRNKYNILIGVKAAEEAKIFLAGDAKKDSKSTFEVKGQDIINGLPKSVKLSQNEILEAIREPLDKIINSIKEALENSPPEIISDLITNGIVLCGGGAKIIGLSKSIEAMLGIKVHIASEPLLAVIRGLKRLLEDRHLLEKYKLREQVIS